MTEKKLTTLQKRFIAECANHPDQTKAYVAAGGSAKTAKQQASKLMTNPVIKAAVEELRSKVIEKANVTTDMIVQELKRMAFFRPEDFLHFNEETQKVETRVTKENMHLLQGVTGLDVIQGQLRFREEKKAALEMLGKYKGMFDKDSSGEDDNKHVTIIFQRDPNPDTRTASNAAP